MKRNRARIDQATTASIGRQSQAAAPKPEAAGDSGQYSTIVARYAASYGVPVSLAHAVISVESNYRPNQRRQRRRDRADADQAGDGADDGLHRLDQGSVTIPRPTSNTA